MGRLIYNICLPVVFLFFLPHLIGKYRSRGGWKNTFRERFGLFGSRSRELSEAHGAVWIHAVSVGETIVALSLIRTYLAEHPERRFILSTTTTTGQDVARSQAPEGTTVIFCPLDFPWMVAHTLQLLEPKALVIFETEIWPNLISMARSRHIPVLLVNGRLSDHSAAGYRRLRAFFAPLFRKFDLILAQSEGDTARFLSVSPDARVETGGNLKFDQSLPELSDGSILNRYLGNAPEQRIILAASTHPGEEALMLEAYRQLRPEFPALKLVLVPRHAERGADVAALLKKSGFTFARKSLSVVPDEPVDILLADTTGEMLQLMKDADIVVMGKSFAGHNEGHNLVEPALLAKPIVTGTELSNFRYIFNVLLAADALVSVEDAELLPTLRKLLADPQWRQELGRRAADTIGCNRGATERTIAAIEKLAF